MRLDLSAPKDQPMVSHSGSLILIAEDDYLIAQDLRRILETAGMQIGGPLASSQAALSWLTCNSPRAAVINVMLQEKPCGDLVIELRRREIPFIVASGLHESQFVLKTGEAWLGKPSDAGLLLSTLYGMFAGENRTGDLAQ